MLQKTIAYQQAHKDRFLEELFSLLRIQSISALAQHKGDCEKCAQAVGDYLEKAGATVQIYPTKGNPVVYAERCVNPAFPTVLVYGHYDVQPVDPLALWHTPPFTPTLKDGKIFARGSADDKGQMFMHIKALEALNCCGELPVNIKFLIEGEEEIGSDNLGIFIKEHRALLKADVGLISDTALFGADCPSIDVGLRGLVYFEVALSGPDRDLHSGVYGGAVANPINILCQIIARLHDAHNRVTIPGFYDKVHTLSEAERADLARAPFNLAAYQQDLGIEEVWGEKGYTVTERTGIRPTLDVNGIWGGYTEEGAKTVLPAQAFAKISCRLVPYQDAAGIVAATKQHLLSLTPKSCRIDIRFHHSAEPYVMPTDNKAYKAAEKAMQRTFQKTPVPIRGGGSIPVVVDLERHLGIKTILLGFGLNDDNLHSPNEKYNVENFYKGIETICYFHRYLADSYACND